MRTTFWIAYGSLWPIVARVGSEQAVNYRTAGRARARLAVWCRVFH